MKKRYLFIGIIILFILINLFGNNKDSIKTSTNVQNTKQTNTEKTIPNGQIGIVKHKYVGYGQIEVYVKNNTGKNIDTVIIKASCKDKERRKSRNIYRISKRY